MGGIAPRCTVAFLFLLEVHALFAFCPAVGWNTNMKHDAVSDPSVQDVNTANTDQDDLNVKTTDVLSLSSIRSTLIRQEETIIFGLIERAAFRSNCIVYEKAQSAEGSFGNLGVPEGAVVDGSNLDNLSFMEYMLLSTELLHNKVRRYTTPEEHAFFPSNLPPHPIANLPELEYPDLLSSDGGASEVNFNAILQRRYIDEIVPSICRKGDDEQHGSSVVCDVHLLQALSRRIHYGKFVAESKYRSDPEGYQQLVDANDHEGVMALLTNASVEAKLLRRVRCKAASYGREPMDLPDMDNSESSFVALAAATAVTTALETWDEGKVDPLAIEGIYRDLIIPLTKDIEVAYLFRRCGKEPPPQYSGLVQ